MSVVKINAISVPEGAGPELEARFAARLGAVERMPALFPRHYLVSAVDNDNSYSLRHYRYPPVQESRQSDPHTQAQLVQCFTSLYINTREKEREGENGVYRY